MCVAYGLACRILVRLGLDANAGAQPELSPAARSRLGRFLADVPVYIIILIYLHSSLSLPSYHSSFFITFYQLFNDSINIVPVFS